MDSKYISLCNITWNNIRPPRPISSALANSRLNYANSVLYNTSSGNMSNSFSRIVTYKTYWAYSPCTSPITPASNQLQNQLLAYEVRSTGSLVYLLPSVSDYTPTRNLCSSSQYLLNVPAVRMQIARQTFSHAAPSVWNVLPVDICWSVVQPFLNSNTCTSLSVSVHKLIMWLHPINTIRASNVYKYI